MVVPLFFLCGGDCIVWGEDCAGWGGLCRVGEGEVLPRQPVNPMWKPGLSGGSSLGLGVGVSLSELGQRRRGLEPDPSARPAGLGEPSLRKSLPSWSL